MSYENAEITKLASNCFKMMKITFANMMRELCDRTHNTNSNVIMETLKKDKLIQNGCFIPKVIYGPADPEIVKNFVMHLKKIWILVHIKIDRSL